MEWTTEPTVSAGDRTVPGRVGSRQLLLCGYKLLADAGRRRFDDIVAIDCPTQEPVADLDVKEALSLMPAASNPASGDERKEFSERQVEAATMKETDRRPATVNKRGRQLHDPKHQTNHPRNSSTQSTTQQVSR